MASEWFSTTEIAKNTWRITDGPVYCYLLEGQDKALLVDTGWGIWDLKALVGGITQKPLQVILTHGHVDHVSGNHQFDRIMVHEHDVSLTRASDNPVARKRAITRFENGPLPPGFDKDGFVQAKMGSLLPFNEGHVFNLGGRIIKTIHVPGHSPGSVCLLDEGNRMLFTGDSINSGDILLLFDTCLSMETFLQSITSLLPLLDSVDMLVPSHGKSPIPASTLLDLRDGLTKILTGEIRGEAHQSVFGPGLLCRFDSCGVLYREDKLR